MSRVYLDYAATSPLRPEVLEAMLPWLTKDFGNASTLYQEGKQARQALDDARAQIASLIGASPTEIIFTAGGTESDNALLAGISQAIRMKKGREKGGNHLVSTAFEHHAILEPLQELRRAGYKITLIKPTREGFITTEAFGAALQPDTLMASVMMANNEIGTIQPIAELVDIAHTNNVLFHTDAVQALGKIAFNVTELGVDAASFSAHKLGGPKGVGAFYLRRSTSFAATMLGGGQELGRRSGTQNVAGAIGFACALKLACAEQEQESARLSALRDQLIAGLQTLDARVSLTLRQLSIANKGTIPALSAHLPHIVSFLVRGLESETLILKLDNSGFAVSGGSACSTGSLEPSHVLMSLGLSRDESYGVIRVSLGCENSEQDIDRFLSTLSDILT